MSQGRWYVHCDGSVRSDSTKAQLKAIDLSTLPFKITFTLESGERVTSWRDSCSDKEYRQLALVLRHWKMKQGAEAPG